ncbi:MAG: M23 family metallopeptidase [Alphaproteobacteria bacterium]|nr:M23 family metallopeptidase [Alphaproteobacteria bacterium]
MALALCLAASACDLYDRTIYGGRPGTVEYPGSGASADAAAIYVVQDGDTLDSVAGRFGVPPQRIVERNSLKPSDKLSSGQWLEIPNARVIEQPSDTAAAPPSAPSSSTPPPSSSDGRVTSSELPPPPGGTPAPAPKPMTGTLPPGSGSPGAPQPVPIPAAGAPAAPKVAHFDWPLRGTTLQGFGARPDGGRNDGLNIGAAKGTPVKASEGGSVAYVGNEVRGLGNLVLLSHPGGYVTAYAHLDQASVKKGATVKKGQTIGTVGQSGGVTQPQLHFEIRQRNKPVDPTTLLP